MEQVERICISVNTTCNLGCDYCYFFRPENRIEKESPLKPEEIFTILKNALNYHRQYNFSKKVKVNFVGSGEPLLHWKNIKEAVKMFWIHFPEQNSLKFYTVTNGTLITEQIAGEMMELKVFPSVSLDGPEVIHDAHRLDHKGKGTLERTMAGIETLRKFDFEIAINTTITKQLLLHLPEYTAFIKEHGFNKVIFDRLVDTPEQVKPITTAVYYQFLIDIRDQFLAAELSHVEIGSLEAYSRNFQGKPDKVCTMFGGSCGAGSNFVIYMGRDVYPCGRMFGDERWKIGDIHDSIQLFPERMKKHWENRQECESCDVNAPCVRDCLLESKSESYSCTARKEFLHTMEEVL